VADTIVGGDLGAAAFFVNGHVAASAVSEKKWGFCVAKGDCLTGFDPEQDTPIALPQQVTVDMKLSGDEFVLFSRKPEAKKDPKTLVVDRNKSIWFKATGGGVHIMMGSAPAQDLLYLASEMPIDRHFEYYYTLLTNQPGKAHVPFSKGAAFAVTSVRATRLSQTKQMNEVVPDEAFLHGSNCPPMQYSQ